MTGSGKSKKGVRQVRGFLQRFKWAMVVVWLGIQWQHWRWSEEIQGMFWSDNGWAFPMVVVDWGNKYQIFGLNDWDKVVWITNTVGSTNIRANIC